LKDVTAVEKEVRRAMKFINENRLKEIVKHNIPKPEQRMYLRNWVANYEISDFFKAEPRNVTFFRFN
jgi:hypothetical protein